ncbi:SCO6745 family protein [Streptomyces sp. cmx-18-6]|uniref:SCO6745 family protein n=1 Tax=Streptomyces sp. cmx-18-6 TaxID=2790930 RepID=UPI00397EA2DD
MSGEPARVRQMWHLLEPLHAVLYYAPQAFAEAAALGYDTEERWASYFAWRAAPLGAVGAEEATRAFHSFAPAMVDDYVPAAWETADPEAVRAARLRAVDRSYRALFGERRVEGAEFAEAAALVRRAAEGASGAWAGEEAASGLRAAEGASGLRGAEGAAPDLRATEGAPSLPAAEAAAPDLRAAGSVGDARGSGGRAGGGGPSLGPANSALPWPDAPHLVLWHAATVLREHRGDGHIGALVAAGLDPVESLVSFAAVGAARPEVFASRGWSAQEWDAARRRLRERGLLEADGTATDAGRELRAKVELRTDEEAAAPWRALGEEGRERLVELLGEPWLETIGSGMLPGENTLGIGKV